MRLHWLEAAWSIPTLASVQQIVVIWEPAYFTMALFFLKMPHPAASSKDSSCLNSTLTWAQPFFKQAVTTVQTFHERYTWRAQKNRRRDFTVLTELSVQVLSLLLINHLGTWGWTEHEVIRKGTFIPHPPFHIASFNAYKIHFPSTTPDDSMWPPRCCTIYLFWDSLWSVILPGIYPTSGRGSLLSTFLPLPLPVPSEMPFCLHISCANPSVLGEAAPACWCPIFVPCSPHWLFWPCVGIGNGLSLPPWWVCGQAHLAHFCILSTCYRAWPPQTLAE